MKKLLAALSIALIAGLGTANAGCPAPHENFVLYSPDFAFYPEALIKAYQQAKKENEELAAKLKKCQEELALLKAKEAELKQRYGELSAQVEELKRRIAEIEALQQRLAELKREAEHKLSSCEELLKKWESLPKSYVVKRGDTLWGISAKDYIYGDPWQWPLIYKANRDKIKNPHLIYPHQKLRIPRDITCKDIIEARREALRTPPPPGVKPKKVGPVKAEVVPPTATDYFLCKSCRAK
ncbi:LysM peptidoglycan-binding domain-containing protein [Thermovibrio ammonificans]|uniref:Peptidoglycan-binding lysin domain protein n=1 Tax=Thermovibrio ammonificans (strain DSM 15698 / JCM 12110 / HB-1) TaxID=648996 RepID=E8T6D4_THEA1|nr:LysM peptidoglycan-binding domain-containing protein [Thermovibrio ammonificans]ADU96718.1 Peptidoglycan-binding lysin domain protein [Thermovibrio ammonificans HB-1]